MGTLNYLTSCIEGVKSTGIERVTSIIALALLGVFALTLLWRMFRGFFRGARLQLLSTCTIFTAILASVLITRLASNSILKFATVDNFELMLTKTVGNTQTTATVVNALNELPTETVQYVLSIPIAVFFAPFMFLAVYGVVRVVLFVAQRVIKHVFRIGKPKSLTERFAGLCLAAVEAVMVFSILVLPATSVISFADEVMGSISTSSDGESAEAEDAGFAELKENYVSHVQPAFAENPAFLIANRSVNDSIVKAVSHVGASVDGQDLREEFIEIVEMILVDVPALKESNLKQPSDGDKARITALIDKLAANGIISNILSGTVSTTAKLIDVETLGISVEPPLDTIVNDVMELLKTCTAETFKDDLYLIKDIYFLLADENILVNLGNEDLLLDALTAKREGEEENAVQKLVSLINDNERTKPLITTLTKLSITMLASQLGNSDFTSEETYESLKGTMNEVLSVKNNEFETHEEYIEALTDTLDSNLKDNGIEIEREIVTGIAEYIDSTYPEASELTDEEFNDVLLSYFDAYLDYVNNGTVPDDLLPPGVDPEDLPSPDSIPGLDGIIKEHGSAIPE